MIKKLIFLFIMLFIVLYGCKDNKKYKVTLIEIMSSSCDSCITVYKPMVEELKKQFKNRVKFLIYDTSTDEGAKIANQYGITKLPTFIFLDENGIEYFRMKDIIIKDAIAALLMTKLDNNQEVK